MEASFLYTIDRYIRSKDYITHFLAEEGRKTGEVEHLFLVASTEDPRVKGKDRIKK